MMNEIAFNSTKGVVTISQTTGWDTYFVFINREKVGFISRYTNGWKFHHKEDYSVFNESEKLLLVDIALRKFTPKSLITPVSIIINGKNFIALKYAPDRYTITKPNGTFQGDIAIETDGDHKKWSSSYFTAEVSAEIGRQLLSMVR